MVVMLIIEKQCDYRRRELFVEKVEILYYNV